MSIALIYTCKFWKISYNTGSLLFFLLMKILVVTATLGERTSLSRAIESVERHGGCKVRHIIVAPASRLNEIKKCYGDDLDYMAEPENKRGIYAALNAAFFTYGRQYDYFAYINDDDYWLPEFENLIKIAEKKEYDVVYAKTLYVDKEGKVLKKQACSCQFNRFNDLFHENVILLTQQTALVKRDLFFKVGGFDDTYKLVADTKFWIQASLLHPSYKFVKRYVYCYTLQPGQLSKDSKTQSVEHGRLRKEYPSKNVLRRKLALLRYRLCNFDIYIERLI